MKQIERFTHDVKPNANVLKVREDWADVFKTLLIFLIVFGHTTLSDNILKQFIYMFHVPGFIMISGFWIKSDRKFSTVFKRRFLNLYVPYLVVGVISIFIFYLMGHIAQNAIGGDYEMSIWPNLKGLLYGNPNYNMKYNLPLWYLPFIFATELLALLLIKLINLKITKRWVYTIISLFLLGLGSMYYYFGPKISLPFGLENTIYLIGFIFFGYGGFEIIKRVRKLKWYFRYPTAIIMFLIAVLSFIGNTKINYTNSSYGNFFLFTLGALAVNIGIILVIPNKTNKFISFVGKNTLITLLFHKFPILFFQIFPPKISSYLKSPNIWVNTPITIIVSIIAILSCLALQIILSKIRGFFSKEKQIP